MKKTCILLAFTMAGVFCWIPSATSIPCEANPNFLNGKCKSEVIGSKTYFYCGSVLAGETPNCTAYVQ